MAKLRGLRKKVAVLADAWRQLSPETQARIVERFQTGATAIGEGLALTGADQALAGAALDALKKSAVAHLLFGASLPDIGAVITEIVPELGPALAPLLAGETATRPDETRRDPDDET
ncbi:MAG: hypothetical protein JO206_01160 [Solirubrobacterales bacterium]|nr:hypothetical protein [Solirubrobacterales bacterium]MBV9837858.1 hypothetical protein [Solirubrobacterales bacterium]